jgi:Holliday junction resolvasome RuvABC DNA-binding subunit
MPEHVTAASSNGHAIEVSLVDDAVSALINLGYKPAEAKRAVDSVSSKMFSKPTFSARANLSERCC